MSLPVVPLILSIKNTSTIVYNSTEYIGTVSCDNGSPKTIYTEIGAVLEANTILYTDAGLTTPMASSTFTYSGIQYTTNGSGAILSSGGTLTCLLPITVYADCNENSPTVVYPSAINSPLTDGTAIFSNGSGSTETGLTAFVYNDGQYNYTPNPGALSEYTGKCRDEYVGTISCSDGTVRTIYVIKDTPLQVGTVLYTDVFLTTTLVSTTFVYSGTRYNTDGTGAITSVFVCLTSYTVYTNCVQDTPITIYGSSPPNSTGAHFYQDSDGSDEIGIAGYVYSGAEYSYSTGPSGAQYVQVCPT